MLIKRLFFKHFGLAVEAAFFPSSSFPPLRVIRFRAQLNFWAMPCALLLPLRIPSRALAAFYYSRVHTQCGVTKNVGPNEGDKLERWERGNLIKEKGCTV